VKTGAARGRSRTRRRQGCLLPLLQRRHDAVFFLLADEPCRPSSPVHALRPVATKVRTSFPCPLWTPRPSSRGGTRCSHRATAPPPVMPAFEPGWEVFSCRCCCQLHRVRVVALFVSWFLGPPYRASPLLATVVARCRRIRVHACTQAGSPPLRGCAPQHARILAGEVQAGPLVLFPLRRTSPRRYTLARRVAMALP
jgi:hypothetical protein